MSDNLDELIDNYEKRDSWFQEAISELDKEDLHFFAERARLRCHADIGNDVDCLDDKQRKDLALQYAIRANHKSNEASVNAGNAHATALGVRKEDIPRIEKILKEIRIMLAFVLAMVFGLYFKLVGFW